MSLDHQVNSNEESIGHFLLLLFYVFQIDLFRSWNEVLRK